MRWLNKQKNSSAISEFAPALSIHQIPLFNTLSGYGSYIFPAVADYPSNHFAGFVHVNCDLSFILDAESNRILGIIQCHFDHWFLGCLYLFGFTFWLNDYPRGGNFWGMLIAVPIFVSCVIGLSMLIASFSGYAGTFWVT